MNKNEKISLNTIFKGGAMGIAEVIPGVSGGTIAFITGIYERLINCIKSFDGKAIQLLFGFKLKQLWQHIDGTFILSLAIGMLLGIVVGVLGVGYLLENFPAPIWAFFFGLIIASAIYIGRQVEKWGISPILALILGMVIALGVTYISPAEGSGNLLWVFICGVIAISALILPGVSGSFILLLMGMYTVVRSAAENVMTQQDMSSLMIILVFMIGCGVGLLSFARVMSYAFKNFKNITLALLTGFMLGSLRKIWPWRNVSSYLDKETGQIVEYNTEMGTLPEEIQILKEIQVLPSGYLGEPQTVIAIFALIIGFVIVFIFDRFSE